MEASEDDSPVDTVVGLITESKHCVLESGALLTVADTWTSLTVLVDALSEDTWGPRRVYAPGMTVWLM